MRIAQQKAIIIDLTCKEYDSLVKELNKDAKSLIIFFERIREVGNEKIKEFCRIKIKKNKVGEHELAMKQFEYCTMEYTGREYKFFHAKADGSKELAFLRLLNE